MGEFADRIPLRDLVLVTDGERNTGTDEDESTPCKIRLCGFPGPTPEDGDRE